MTKIKIRMLQTVRPDLILGLIPIPGSKPDTVLYEGKEYEAQTNMNGAISGLCKNGEYLGVKPGEFEFIDAPEWVLKIHRKPEVSHG